MHTLRLSLIFFFKNYTVRAIIAVVIYFCRWWQLGPLLVMVVVVVTWQHGGVLGWSRCGDVDKKLQVKKDSHILAITGK